MRIRLENFIEKAYLITCQTCSDLLVKWGFFKQNDNRATSQLTSDQLESVKVAESVSGEDRWE